jgi:membrane fusion protein (multidrug efflux system)
MKKILIYGIGTLAILAGIIFKLKSNQRENAEHTAIVKESASGAVPVLVSQVVRTKFDNTFTANGNFEAINQIELASDVAGRITQLFVKEGSYVKAGQVIARVDNEIFRADLQAEKARVDQARQDLERYQKALETGGVTQKQVDDMKLQFETTHSKYIQAEKKLNDAQIKAPVNGMINQRYVELGTYLALGAKVVEIVDISRLKLTVSVTESQVVQLNIGDKVTVTSTVFPETKYAGTVTFIAAKGDATLNYPVEIEIANVKGKELKAGMYGSATFNLPEQSPLMLIPRAAFTGGVNSNQVFVLENGQSHLRKVIAARTFGTLVEVREGLTEGETVITSGQINLTEGTIVSVQQ